VEIPLWMMTTKTINRKRNEFTLLDNKGSTAVCCLYYYTRKFSFCQGVITPFEVILYQFYFIRQVIFPIFLQKNSKIIAPNVPAVCDGLAARIRKCVAFPGPTNCAGATAWVWSVAE
jgi:hypothetical protein